MWQPGGHEGKKTALIMGCNCNMYIEKKSDIMMSESGCKIIPQKLLGFANNYCLAVINCNKSSKDLSLIRHSYSYPWP